MPLEGKKIIDLAHLAPGAYCTLMLSDLGAEVIRVDQPPSSTPDATGKDESAWGFERAMARAYAVFNRDKKSIAINLKSEQGRSVFFKLAEDADVILEGFRAGVVGRLGVGYEAVKQRNPRIVYCSLSGYGQEGPYKDLPGHDVNYIGVAGALDLFGQRDGAPVIPLNFVGDWAGGMLHSVVAILAAILEREKTGQGQYLDMAYIDGVVSFLSLAAYEHLVEGLTAGRGETPAGGGFPCYNVYRASDGKYVTIGCFEPSFWKNLCHALGRPDFVPYQWDEGEKRKEILSWLNGVFATKSRDEWFDFLRDKDVCVGKVNTLGEVFSDPQVAYRRMLLKGRDGTKGQEAHVRTGVRFHDALSEVKNPAPRIGQHTQQVLKSLGYNEKQIEQLGKTGATYDAKS